MKNKKSLVFIACLCIFLFIFGSCSPKRGIVPCPSYGSINHAVEVLKV